MGACQEGPCEAGEVCVEIDRWHYCMCPTGRHCGSPSTSAPTHDPPTHHTPTHLPPTHHTPTHHPPPTTPSQGATPYTSLHTTPPTPPTSCFHNWCQNEASCVPAPSGVGYECACQDGFGGPHCENGMSVILLTVLFHGHKNAVMRHHTSKNGRLTVYTIVV